MVSLIRRNRHPSISMRSTSFSKGFYVGQYPGDGYHVWRIKETPTEENITHFLLTASTMLSEDLAEGNDVTDGLAFLSGMFAGWLTRGKNS